MRRFLRMSCVVMLGALGVARAQVTTTASGGVVGTGVPVSSMMGPVALSSIPEGFFMTPVKNQPYSLVEKTTNVQVLADGTTITRPSEQHRMRDAEGRERFEIGSLKDGKFEPALIILNDPVARTRTNLSIFGKTAHVQHFAEPKPVPPEQEARAAEFRAKAEAYRKEHPEAGKPGNEDLPSQSIAGIYAEGKRHTLVIPVGRMGNDRELHTVTETWTSPDLKITLLRTNDDPRVGKSRTEVSELSRGDPPPALFQIPADYKVIDLKKDGLQ